MIRVYTDIWNDFQFRQLCYIDGHFEKYKFDLVKWVNREPIVVTDLKTGEHTTRPGRYCFSIGQLTWDKREGWFDFESVGTRYLEHRIDGLEEWILEFCDMMEKELSED